MTTGPRFVSRLPFSGFAFAISLGVLTMLTASPTTSAQTLTVLHAFGSQPTDGANPLTGLTMDGQGNLYGTASSGGNVGGSCGNGCGAVFELKRIGSDYSYRSLYSFQGGNDGASPQTAITIGPNGSLYGATSSGGGNDDLGTVFNLKPQPTICRTTFCPWRETQILRFNLANGAGPTDRLIFDGAGNLYSTTSSGGLGDQGEVFELSPTSGSWTENILYSFSAGLGGGGYQPYGGVISDHAGTLYGTTQWGGEGGYGTVYQLTLIGGSWTRTALYSFTGGNDGGRPANSLLMDAAGNLYGTTGWLPEGNNPGTVYELSPSGGGWTYHLLYTFPAGAEGAGAVSSLTMDDAGNLYGTTQYEGNLNCQIGCGNVFKLSPSGNGWSYTDLHDFTGGADGYWPVGGVVLDSQGNVYGTTYLGGTGANCLTGAGTCGVAWELSSH